MGNKSVGEGHVEFFGLEEMFRAAILNDHGQVVNDLIDYWLDQR
jgi:hypothetical protein